MRAIRTPLQPSRAGTISGDQLERWQAWEREQPSDPFHGTRVLALVALIVILPLLAWVLYVPVHVDAFVMWIELTVLYLAHRVFERRAILHPREFAIMVALYVSLSSVARIVDYFRVATAQGTPIQAFDVAYRIVAAGLLLGIGYAGGCWLARDARGRFELWRGDH